MESNSGNVLEDFADSDKRTIAMRSLLTHVRDYDAKSLAEMAIEAVLTSTLLSSLTYLPSTHLFEHIFSFDLVFNIYHYTIHIYNYASLLQEK